MVNTVLTSLFVFCVVIGALLGLWRGLGKASIRLISVVCAAIIALFCTPLLTKAILNADISKLNFIQLDDVKVGTVESTILSFLQSISVVGEIMLVSPTLKSLIVALPSAIVNLFLFIVLFMILKSIMYLIYKIVAKITLPKRVSGQPLKFRWLGVVIGAVQGVVVFAVILLPFIGAVNLAGKELTYLNEYSKNNDVVATTLLTTKGELNNVSLGGNKQKITVSTEFDEVEKYVNEISTNWSIKLLNAVGYEKLANKGFDTLTTMEINNEKTTISAEADCITKIYARIDRLKDKNANDLTVADMKLVKEIIGYSFDSTIIGNSTTELVTGVAGAWTKAEPTTFLTLAKPSLNANVINLFDNMLLNLKADSKDDLENDLLATCGLVDVFIDKGLLNDFTGNSSNADTMNSLGSGDTVVKIIEAMTKGKALKNTIPAFVQCGLDFVMPVLNIPVDEASISQEKKDAKMNAFYNNLIAASVAYVDDIKLTNDYKNAFLLIGLSGTDIDTYVETMVTNRSQFTTLATAKAYITTNGYGEGGLKSIKPDFITRNEIIINKSASSINWEIEKYILRDMFNGFSAVNTSLQCEGEAIDKINFEQLGIVFDKIQDSQLLNGVDQKLIISILDCSFLDGVEVGSTLMLKIRNESDYREINFTSVFVTLGNTAKVAKEISQIEGSSPSEVTELSPENVESLLKGLQDETTSEIVKDLASEENLKNAGATESQAAAISDVVDILSEETDAELPTTEEDRQAEANAVKSLVDVAETINERPDSTINIFASQDEADSFIDNIMTSSYVYALTINKGVELGFKTSNGDDPETFTSTLTAQDKNFVENALNDPIYTESVQRDKAENIAKTLFAMNNYSYGENNY